MGRAAVKTSSSRKNTAASKPEILKAESFARIPWLLHGFSTRKGGVSKAYGGNSLNLGITEQDTREAVERNREIFLKELGATQGIENLAYGAYAPDSFRDHSSH